MNFIRSVEPRSQMVFSRLVVHEVEEQNLSNEMKCGKITYK